MTQNGTIHAVATGAGSQAYGVLFNSAENLTASLGLIEVEAGEHAKGVGIDTSLAGRTNSVGDNARITVSDTLSVVASDANSQGYGIDLLGGDHFSLTAADIEVRAGGLARGIDYRAGDEGALSVLGDITATATSGNAQGVLVNARDDFQAAIKNVTVEGGGNAVQGIALNLGAGGHLTHEGTIDVTGTTASSNVRGLNVVAEEAFSASIGDVAVQGLSNALGVYWQSTDDASLTLTGTIVSRTTNVNGNAGGATVMAGDRLSIHAGDVEATSSGANSHATGLYVQAGDYFEGVVGSLKAEGNRFVTGLSVFVKDGATAEVDVINAAAHDTGSTAYGANVTAQEGLTLTIGDILAHAGADARGLQLTAGAGATIVHKGAIEARASDTGTSSTAAGVRVDDEGDLSMTLGDVVVSSDRNALGALITTKGKSALSVTGDIVVTGHGDDSIVHGVQFSGTDARELEMELKNVVLDAGRDAYAINLGGTSSVLTIRGDVTAKTRGGMQAWGLIVNSKVAKVTNHGHMSAVADYATAVTFSQYNAAERVHFHNLGTIEATGNLLTSGVVVNVTESAIVKNDGAILTPGKTAFTGSNSTGAIHLTNTGLIDGNVQLGTGADELTLTDTSELRGNVNLGAGDDLASIDYGAVFTGLLDGGAGDDTLRLLGTAASTLPPGSSWSALAARNIERVFVDGGAWQLGSDTTLGSVVVNDAFLRIDDPVTVAGLQLNGGGLVGEGRVRGAVTNDGGVVAPGNSYGILTIQGDYVQGPDGVLHIELDTTSPPEAGITYDQLVVTGGTATFADGTTVKVTAVLGPVRPSRIEYVIVEGDVEFDPDAIHVDLDSRESLFYGGWLEHGSMTLVIGDMPYESAGVTGNQKTVARALDEVKESPAAGIADLIDWLNDRGADDGPAVRAVFDSLSGEVYTHVPTLEDRRMHAFAGAISRGLDALTAGHEGAGAAGGAAEPGKRLWAAAYSDAGNIAAGEGTAASSFNLSGLVAGADIVMTPTLRIGLSAGGGASSLTMKDRASELEGRGLDVGAYGRFIAGSAEVTAVIVTGRGTYTAERTVQYGTESRKAEAELQATGVTMAAEARFQPRTLGGFDVEPIASLSWFHGRRAAFEEKGAGEAGLSASEQSLSSLSGRFGLEAALSEWMWGNTIVLPYARLALITGLSPTARTMDAKLVGAPDASFTVQGTPAQRSGLEVGLGIQSASESSLGWGLDYAGEFRADQNDHSVRARLSIAF